jgi:hypothetical protein
VEVKPEKFIPKFADTFDAAGDILQQRNFKFCVVSELQIDINDEPESIDLLLRYAKGSFPRSNIEAVKQFISGTTTREISIKEVCDCTNSSIHLLFHLLGRRSLRFSKEISTSPNTLILGNAGGEYYDNVFIPDWLNNTQWTANSRVRQNDNGVGSSIRRSHHTPNLHVAISKITSEILTGKLQVVGGVERKNHDVDSSSGFISSIDSLPEKYKLDFEFKIKLIKWLQKMWCVSRSKEISRRKYKKFFELHPDIKVKRPSASAVMGWMREWEISNNNPACLISKISNASELPIYLISLNKKFRKF